MENNRTGYRVFNTASLREITDRYDREEISYGKMVDLINEKAEEVWKQEIAKAMHHALDEDGHTGDWRIKFVNDYINKQYGKRNT